MSEQEIDYETEARNQGWVPEEEWKGDEKPKEFVDAKTFVERGEEINGKLKGKISTLESEIEALKNANREFGQQQQKLLDKERKERERLIEELEAKREQAVSEGDGPAYTQTDRQINELRSQDVPDKEGYQQLAQAWHAQNPWYLDESNPEHEAMSAWADWESTKIQKAGYTGQAYFNELTRRMRNKYSDYFDGPKPPPAVEGGRASEERVPNPQSFEALDQEGKAAFERFFQAGFYGDDRKKAQAKYIAHYDWDQ